MNEPPGLGACVVCYTHNGNIVGKKMIMVIGNKETLDTTENGYCRTHAQHMIREFRDQRLAFPRPNANGTQHVDEAMVKWEGDKYAYFL